MKIKCKVCGMKFMPTIEKTYKAQKSVSPLATLSGCENLFDAIDCPRCGCQKILNSRIPNYKEIEGEYENEN